MKTEEFIVRGDVLEKLPDTNAGQYLLDLYKDSFNVVALVDGVTGIEYSYRQVYDNVVRISLVLRDLGIKKGDTVSICSENTVLYPQVTISCLVNGIQCSPFNAEYTDRELKHGINLSRPKLIICSPSVVEKVQNCAKGCPFVKLVIPLWSDTKNTNNIMKMKDKISPDRVKRFQEINMESDDVALIMCSSGTTGLPKGVMITHSNILSYFAAQSNPTYNNMIGSYTLGYLPMYHAYGLIFCLFASTKAATTVVIPRFIPDLFLKCVQDYQIATMATVPPIIAFLAKHPMALDYDLSCLKFVGCGAAPLSSELESLFLKRYPSVEFIKQGYGMSESTLGILYVPIDQYKPGSTGRPVPGMEFKVVDPANNKALGPRQAGEIVFRGPMVMKGYIGNSEATAATIDPEGWLHSGDIGYYDEEGWFYVVDRLKELIKYKGFQVAPAEIEALLQCHPAIMDAAVIGVPDDDAGELPKAFVVKKSPVTEQEIVDFISSQVSNAKKLRGGVEFVDVIPKSPSGKILRRELRDKVKKEKSKL